MKTSSCDLMLQTFAGEEPLDFVNGQIPQTGNVVRGYAGYVGREYHVGQSPEWVVLSRRLRIGQIKNNEIPGVIHLGGRILIGLTVIDQWIDAPESTARGWEDKFVLRKREAI